MKPFGEGENPHLSGTACAESTRRYLGELFIRVHSEICMEGDDKS